METNDSIDHGTEVTPARELDMHALQEERVVQEQERQLLLSNYTQNSHISSTEGAKQSRTLENQEYASPVKDFQPFLRNADTASANISLEKTEIPEQAEGEKRLQTLTDEWLQLAGVRVHRRFLESHLDLLSPQCEEYLHALIAEESEYKEVQNFRLRVIQVAQARGRTIQAVRDAYVNQADGFALDVPEWLEEAEQQIKELRNKELTLEVYTSLLALVRRTVARARYDARVPSETVAELRSLQGRVLQRASDEERTDALEQALNSYEIALWSLQQQRFPLQYAYNLYVKGNVYLTRIQGDAQSNQEQAVLLYEAALKTFNREDFSELWATIEYYLGMTYLSLADTTGDRRAYRDKIITHSEAALEIFTSETHPAEWAGTHHHLAFAYEEDETESPEENRVRVIFHAEAALSIYTKENAPMQWVLDHRRLAEAYSERTEGERATNIEKAIDHHHLCLQIYTQEAYPSNWAMTHFLLQELYRERITGDHLENVEQSIACCLATLTVYTPERTPSLWAATYLGLSVAYSERAKGLRRANMEEAIDCGEKALSIYTYDDYPERWGATQVTLADYYRSRVSGERRTNLEEAIACCERALQVFTPADHSTSWALTQMTLGTIYIERIEGERRTNVEKALAYCRESLKVITKENAPKEWALLHMDQGFAYLLRIDGERRDNLEEAISYCETALSVLTKTTFPFQWVLVQINLAEMYRNRVAGDTRTNLEQAMMHCENALSICTPTTIPYLWALVEMSLGNIYQMRIEGEKRKNMEQAIACYRETASIYSLDASPYDWAKIQQNLGIIYATRIEGEVRVNLEQAIISSNCALEVFRQDTTPVEWATIQINLGDGYRLRFEGKKQDNLEQAIEYYQEGLKVFTKELHPIEYARAQMGLASTYHERISGYRPENIELAITSAEAALSVFTFEALPQFWASTYLVLGNAYLFRIEGDRETNVEKGIECCNNALRVHTREKYPFENAMIYMELGFAYLQRISGEPRENPELAIADFEIAERQFSREAFPQQWSILQINLGEAWRSRIEGIRADNLELAITYFNNGLEICTYEALPVYYALANIGLGSTYAERLVGEERTNKKRAVTYYENALRVYTPTNFPTDYAKLQINMAFVYVRSAEQEPQASMEQVIACCNAALTIYMRETYPREWALAKLNLATCYRLRDDKKSLELAVQCYDDALGVQSQLSPFDRSRIQLGLSVALLKQYKVVEAIQCCEETLRVHTLEEFPEQWAQSNYLLALMYMSNTQEEFQDRSERAIRCCNRALQIYTFETYPAMHRKVRYTLCNLELACENWEQAHTSFETAYDAEKLLISLGTGFAGRDIIIKEGQGAAQLHAFALTRIGRTAEAAVVLERGRARGLAEALTFDAADPELIKDPDKRARYTKARQAFQATQGELSAPMPRYYDDSRRRETELRRDDAYKIAKADFDTIVAEIRATNDPADFLLDTLDAQTIVHATTSCGAGHALVYLAASYIGGLAVISLHPELVTPGQDTFVFYDLPNLTDSVVTSLFFDKAENEDVLGGFSAALLSSSQNMLDGLEQEYTWREFVQQATQSVGQGRTGTLIEASQTLLKQERFGHIVDTPLHSLTKQDREDMNDELSTILLRLEVQRYCTALSEQALGPLVAYLQTRGVTSITLIPCGVLTVFPLVTIPLQDDRTVGETLGASVAPSARSLLRDRRHSSERKREGVYAVGNPYRKWDYTPLPYSEKEAQEIVRTAQRLGMVAEVQVQHEATKEWLVEKLHIAQVVDAACHGNINRENFLDSSLYLANSQSIKLGEVLNGKINIQGLRLLILAACLTATPDMMGAIDEVRSLAVGMVQAGAEAVIATSWSVDDVATCLLMVRFAEEWLPRIEWEPPAAALARAQYWLRHLTNQERQEWLALHALEEPTPAVDFTANDEDEALLLWSNAISNQILPRRATEPLSSLCVDPDQRPYEDPSYWAGFQVIGW